MSGDPLRTPLSAVDELAQVALGEIWVAVCAFPEAWPIAEIIYGVQCQPSKIVEAGETWIDMAGTLAKATDRIEAHTGSFPATAWTGKDREAFDRHISDYVGEVYFDQAAALVVGGVTVAVGVLLALLVLACFLVASLLSVMALLFYSFLSTGVGSAAALEIQEAAADVCEWAESTLGEFAETIKGLSNTGAVLIDGALALNAVGQLATGNVDVIKDLLQATVYTSLDAVAGYASKREQDLTSDGIGHTNQTVRATSLGYGTGTALAGEAVDTAGPWATGDGWNSGGDAWKGP